MPPKKSADQKPGSSSQRGEDAPHQSLDAKRLLELRGEELERFESFRRSAIPKPQMKKLLHAVTGQVPDVNSIIVMCGVAKLLVGDIVEHAKKIATEDGHHGPLRESDIRRAYAQHLRNTKLPLGRSSRKKLL
eukprot:CAMPEP_0198246656 /NCGR_PEP_ID=MMETSP1446-20131203/46087_1 /TAXON_ID=1461542 ORGANISM="Unidentified sp, Strain CCMP2111" /NCGR_SAMPLE_ID=MMETSP1446 /ASSEMBLY_ACC=CAM_ASM_001112 /LENGTH=132 /DNA_ID=CAMNT_0043930979 /DNA_START=268 /DNA_END=666 /DNA_ORIENTATION=-